MTAEFISESGETPDPEALTAVVAAFHRHEGVPTDRKVCIVFLDDDGIAAYNRTFFNKYEPTDVISVNIDDELNGEYLWGEIYVSTETARREAEARGISWEHETVLYVVHGLFHLDGHTDATDEERRRMWQRQLAFLQTCGYAPDLFGEQCAVTQNTDGAGALGDCQSKE